MSRKSVQRAVMEERARHVQTTETPALKFLRSCVAAELTGKKFENRLEARAAMTEIAKACAARNPYRKKATPVPSATGGSTPSST